MPDVSSYLTILDFRMAAGANHGTSSNRETGAGQGRLTQHRTRFDCTHVYAGIHVDALWPPDFDAPGSQLADTLLIATLIEFHSATSFPRCASRAARSAATEPSGKADSTAVDTIGNGRETGTREPLLMSGPPLLREMQRHPRRHQLVWTGMANASELT